MLTDTPLDERPTDSLGASTKYVELTGYPQNRTAVLKWRAGDLAEAAVITRTVLGDRTATGRKAGPVRRALCCRVRNGTARACQNAVIRCRASLAEGSLT